MAFDPGHLILAFAILALAVPALSLAPAPARSGVPLFSAVAPASAISLTVEPERPATQIARLDAIVMSAVEKARRAERLHNIAHEQVDAADYALQGLKNELAAVAGLLSGAAVPVRAVPARGLPASPRFAVASALAA